jgi:hypothetical protein
MCTTHATLQTLQFGENREEEGEGEEEEEEEGLEIDDDNRSIYLWSQSVNQKSS